MFSKFFIQNPIFASVISIVIGIAGAVAVGGSGGGDVACGDRRRGDPGGR